MDGCRLCLDPYATGPINPLENPYLQEQLDTVFNFTIDTTTQPTPAGICQQCSTIVSDFYQFSIKVRRNQEQLIGSLQANIKIEATEFVVTPVAESDLKEEFKEELSEEEDIESDKSPSPEQPAESNDEDDRGRQSNRRKRKPLAVQTGKSKKTNPEFKEELPEEELSGEQSEEDCSDNDESYEPLHGKHAESSDEDDLESLTKETRKLKNDEDEGRIKPKIVRNFSSNEQIKADFKKINEFYQMKCDDCGVVTENFSSLKTHHKEVHSRMGYIACCRRKLKDRKKMLEHMELHENPEAFRCHICNKNYSERKILEAHTKAAHSCEEEKVFKCQQCPQSFALNRLLKVHMWIHKQEGCKDCGKKFASKSGLRVHQLKMHSGIDRRMICDICGQEYLDKDGFDRHVKEHAGIEVLKQLQCQICQKWFRGKLRLKIHLKNTHYDRGIYTCNICNRQCPSKYALLSHQKVVHVTEKYKCEFCDAKFKQPQSLKEHRAIHTGEVLFSCEYCGKSTNSHANFYVHIKKEHPQEWALKKQSKMPKAAAGSGT